MTDEFDELLDEEEPLETPTPEEIVSLPMTTAASLMPPEEEETPPEPQDSEPPPPGERHGDFIVQRDKAYGDGYRDLVLNDLDIWEGVGSWLNREYPNLNGEHVMELLTNLGLPMERAVNFARNRDPGTAATAYLDAHPAVQELAHQEMLHNQTKESFSKAFIERQQREGKKK